MIELRAVNKHYADLAALQDISLTVQAGEIAGVIGKSGAGKSTLIRCVNLLERPTSGQVLVGGENLMVLSPVLLRAARKKIGMIFQQFNLLSSKTVYENINLALNLVGKKNKNILSLLELTDLMDKKDFYPAQLSGGQQQRVAIARALAMNPSVLLCDEATSSLDPHNTEIILGLLKKINREFKLTILLITHEMNVIKHACDKVIVLDQGRVIETGPVAQVFSSPVSPVTQYFVDSALKAELPSVLKEKIMNTKKNNNIIPVWRIYFQGKEAAQPIMAGLAQEYQVNINILQASLECIQHLTLGIMILAVDAEPEKYEAALGYLGQKNVKVEVMGYVSRESI